MDSILITIKAMLGIHEGETYFDTDIIVNINSVLMMLTQLGLGPPNGFMITGNSEEWRDLLLDSTELEAVKTYIYLKVKVLFDPPNNSFTLDAIERMTKELEWRLNVKGEEIRSNE